MKLFEIVFTCSRCGREQRYPSGNAVAAVDADGWVAIWPSKATPVGWELDALEDPAIVCPGCLTETEALVVAEVRASARDIPFE
jgi:hypothetical protein